MYGIEWQVKVCERQKRVRDKQTKLQSLVIILYDALLNIPWTYCPSHSFAEGLIEYSSLHIDTIMIL